MPQDWMNNWQEGNIYIITIISVIASLILFIYIYIYVYIYIYIHTHIVHTHFCQLASYPRAVSQFLFQALKDNIESQPTRIHISWKMVSIILSLHPIQFQLSPGQDPFWGRQVALLLTGFLKHHMDAMEAQSGSLDVMEGHCKKCWEYHHFRKPPYGSIDIQLIYGSFPPIFQWILHMCELYSIDVTLW